MQGVHLAEHYPCHWVQLDRAFEVIFLVVAAGGAAVSFVAQVD
jgi:hypothetical protein